MTARLRHPTSLDVHWHVMSDEGLDRLASALPHVRTDASDSRSYQDEDERYVAVGE